MHNIIEELKYVVDNEIEEYRFACHWFFFDKYKKRFLFSEYITSLLKGVLEHESK